MDTQLTFPAIVTPAPQLGAGCYVVRAGKPVPQRSVMSRRDVAAVLKANGMDFSERSVRRIMREAGGGNRGQGKKLFVSSEAVLRLVGRGDGTAATVESVRAILRGTGTPAAKLAQIEGIIGL